MRHGIKKIVGKRIKGVITKAKSGNSDCNVFLIFTDDTSYEFYTICDNCKISCAGGVDPGGVEAVEKYLSEVRTITLKYIDDSIKD